jgi:spectinomycin phosphotransferase
LLEIPDIPDQTIITCLMASFGLSVIQLTFLPLGADQHTAVYRASTAEGPSYFVKLRLGSFDETGVTLPRYLIDHGMQHIIALMQTRDGHLWANLETFKVMVFPYVEGQDIYDVSLDNHHWVELGVMLKKLHTIQLSRDMAAAIRREDFSDHWRKSVSKSLERIAKEHFDDPIAGKCANFLETKQKIVWDLLQRADCLAAELQGRRMNFVLCHSDIHAGNLLLDASDRMYLIDWDAPIFAPKERDLMSIGASLFGGWRTPQEEEELFYCGYGSTNVDPVALAYYRYERIIEDIAVECEIIFSSDRGQEDRERELGFLISNFLPNSTLEVAYRSDSTSLSRADF